MKEQISVYEFKRRLKNSKEEESANINYLGAIISLIFIEWLSITIFIFRDKINLHLAGSLGSLGGYISGTLGTMATIIGVWFVYKTYISQKIESRFFELLKLHQEDVDLIYAKEGENAFEAYVSITRSFAQAIEKYIKENKIKGIQKTEILQIAFSYMIYGLTSNESTNTIKHNISDSIKGRINLDELTEYLFSRNYTYKGAYFTISTYFRQLYQTINYINNRSEIELSVLTKYQYGKMLRVRLSIDEQYLLFLNSLVKVGEVWDYKHEGLISKYNMLTNIPSIYPFILEKKINERDLYPNVDYEDDTLNIKIRDEQY